MSSIPVALDSDQARREILAQLERGLVPTLADWYAICLCKVEGEAHHSMDLRGNCAQSAAFQSWFEQCVTMGAADDHALAALLRSGRSLLIAPFTAQDYDRLGRDAQSSELLRSLELTSVLCVPLMGLERLCGAVWLAFADSGRLHSSEDLLLAEMIIRPTALALENVRRAAAAERAAKRATARTIALQELTTALVGAIIPADVADVVINKSLPLLGAYAGSLVLVNERGDGLDLVRTQGYSANSITPFSAFPFDPPTPIGDAVQTRSIVCIGSMDEWQRKYPHVVASQNTQLSPSVVAIPLSISETVVGALGLSFAQPRSFSDDEMALMQLLGNQCAQALERAQLYEAERLARLVAETVQRRQTVLTEALRVLANATLNLDEVLERVTRQIAETLRDGCVIHLLHHDSFTFTRGVSYHHDLARMAALDQSIGLPPAEDDHNLISLVASLAQPIMIPRVTHDQLVELAPAQGQTMLAALNVRSVIVMPLCSQGNTLGCLTLVRDVSPLPYSDDDIFMLSEIVDRAALAIANAQLYAAAQEAQQATEQAARRTTRLQRVAAALSAAITSTEVAEVIISEGLGAMQADAGSLFALVDDGQTFQLLSYRGYPNDLAPNYVRRPSAVPGPLFEAIQSKKIVVSLSAQELVTRWPRMAAVQARVGDQATVAVPLLLQHKAVGVLYVAFRSARLFSAEDHALLLALGHQCALALERARLYEVEQQARTEAEAAVRLRDNFFSTASHELKTPLTTLLGQAELFVRRLSKANPVDPQLLNRAQVIVTQSKRLDRLVNALLDFSRIEQGRLSIERVPVVLSALVQQVIDEIQPTLSRHTLLYDTTQPALSIDGDPLRLEQVIHNLIGNAVKYSPAGGDVCITSGLRDDRAFIAVKDEGIGIPTDALPSLFTQFYRANNANKSQISGLGIGLYVVKEIVTLHDGSIEVASSEGAGSTFTILLPVDSQTA